MYYLGHSFSKCVLGLVWPYFLWLCLRSSSIRLSSSLPLFGLPFLSLFSALLPFSHSGLFQSSLLLFPVSIFCFSSLVFLVIALKRWDLSVAVNAGMTSEVLSWSGETWTCALSYKSQFCCYSNQACWVLKGVLTPFDKAILAPTC